MRFWEGTIRTKDGVLYLFLGTAQRREYIRVMRGEGRRDVQRDILGGQLISAGEGKAV
jgi:hypothetical protein